MNGFDQASVERGIAGTRFAGKVRHFPSVGSTNSMAMEAAQDGVRGGVWVADEQTAGRGRGGHAWHSAMGEGLYVSALVTLRVAAARAMWVSLATGLAARAAIAEATDLTADIRWPNDLLLHGRKCGGILVESSISAGAGDEAGLRYAVIGVGINMEHERFPEELAAVATSLRIEAGREIVRETLLIALLRGLDRELALLDASIATGSYDLLDRFRIASTWVQGKRVRVGEGDGYTGVTAGLDANGFLRADAEDGTRRTVLSGGVRELK